jgi:hypothetical protein
MLRGSSTQSGSEVNLDAIVQGRATDSLVPGGSALLRFTDAALSDPTDLPSARQALVDALGEAAMVDAAGVIGNFQRMVRIADSTGIPVDGFFDEANADVREQLGLNGLPSARLSR